MATYDYSSYYMYGMQSTGDMLIKAVSFDSSGTVSTTDSEFETGDTTTISFNTALEWEFYGYYVGESGTKYLVVDSGEGVYYFFSPDSKTDTGSDLPSTIDFESVDTTDPVVCFAAGTLIATPDGETEVEGLQIGDLILTAEGASVPVKWLGRRKVSKLFTPADRLRPVRVSAGALGNGLPHSDLILTADHALIMDGLAINASALVNGTTISFEPMDRLPDQFTYFHVETEDHNVILANGAPAETYIDYIARSAFDNHREYLALYGSEKVIPEMPLPRISAARMLPDAIRAKLHGAKAA